MSLRRATAADAPTIAALTRAAYAKWVPVLGREPLPMRADYDEALRRHRFDLWEEAGAVRALIETAPDGDYLLIVNLAVDPAAQGRGLGSRLIARAEDIAAAQGFAGLRLYTNRLAVANIDYYGRRGFAVEREAPLNGGVAVYMTRLISARA